MLSVRLPLPSPEWRRRLALRAPAEDATGPTGPTGATGPTGPAGVSGVTPPYFTSGATSYSFTGYAVTKPAASPTWINSVTPTEVAGANGDLLLSNTGTAGTAFWAETSGTTSVEAEFLCMGTQTSNTADCGVWAYDSTNSHIWLLGVQSTVGGLNGGAQLFVAEWTYSGTGNPSFSNTTTFPAAGSLAQGIYHFKILKSGSSLNFQVSLNGGQNFITLVSQSGIGTLADLGYTLEGPNAGSQGLVMMDVLSLVVQ